MMVVIEAQRIYPSKEGNVKIVSSYTFCPPAPNGLAYPLISEFW